jgi:hypothetical protein
MHTEEVPGDQAIGEPPRGYPAGEVLAVGREVGLGLREPVVVVAGVDDGVAEDVDRRDVRLLPDRARSKDARRHLNQKQHQQQNAKKKRLHYWFFLWLQLVIVWFDFLYVLHCTYAAVPGIIMTSSFIYRGGGARRSDDEEMIFFYFNLF